LYKSPRGTADILPEDQKYWRFIESRAEQVCRLYGYQRLDTPVFEESQLFTRSIGEGTDIVTKEMYVFKDQSDNSLALRPEGTAPVCRAYVEHGMDNQPQPVKLFYMAAIFRYERPQAGRYRQHHQFGCECIGDASPLIDAEVIDMACRYFDSLGLTDYSLQLNSIGCQSCRPIYLENLKNYYAGHIDELCEDCSTRYQKNPLRLLDCKKASCQRVADNSPKSSEHLCPECQQHFQELQRYLDLLELAYSINHRLVRGLDYYSRTVFEIQPAEEGSQSALGGGGRYDNLIEAIGGKSTPAIGFGSGIERVILNLKKQNINIPDLPGPRVYIASLGQEAKEAALRLTADLRRHDIPSLASSGEKSLKAQLRQANGFSVEYTAIIGEDEVKNDMVTLRNMQTGEQQTMPASAVIKILWESQPYRKD
jgi:histidyl-tRNA synthetase